MSSILTVLVARHGQTALNADGVLRGHLDVELDGAGRLEAARLANTFARLPLARIVSSPLQRARQTAAPIAAVLDLVDGVWHAAVNRVPTDITPPIVL